MIKTTVALGFQKLAGFFYSGLGATYTTTVTPGTGVIENFNVLKRPVSSVTSSVIGNGGASGTVIYTENSDIEFELEVWGNVVTVGTFTISSSSTGTGQGSMLASYATDINGNVTGLVDPAGTAINISVPKTFAEFQTAISNGFVGTAFITDIGNGSIWVSDGVRGRPLNGEVVIYNSQAVVNLVTTTPRAVGIVVPLPVGLFQDNDVLEISIDESKSGTVDASTTQLQIGTSQVTVGTQVGNSSMVMSSGGNRRAFGTYRIKRNSATSVTVLNGPNGQDGVSASSDLAASTSSPASLDAGTNYLQLTNAMTTGGSDVVSVNKFIVRLITG